MDKVTQDNSFTIRAMKTNRFKDLLAMKFQIKRMKCQIKQMKCQIELMQSQIERMRRWLTQEMMMKTTDLLLEFRTRESG